MIVIFDLDDTLYNEFDFVKSGFQAVAKELVEKLPNFSNENVLTEELLKEFSVNRNEVFNRFLQYNKVYTKKLLLHLINVYRYHVPVIKLPDETIMVLRQLSYFPKYIVTDGNRFVQRNKVESLGLNKYFKKIFYSRDYGIKNEKPSTISFEKIAQIEKSKFHNMIYIGDNPNKDFVGIKKINVATIRILTKSYSEIKPKPEFEADFIIENLKELPSLIQRIQNEKNIYNR